MIIDLIKDEMAPVLHADICIVGSGAAGLAAASGLDGSGFSVLIAESGEMKFSDRVQELYKIEADGLPFEGAVNGRFRTLGGSTVKWGGQSLPLTPFDFEERPWITQSGWPIKYEELSPYYPKAHTYLNVDQLNYSDELYGKLKITPPLFDPGLLEYHFSKWSTHPDLRNIHLPLLRKSTNVTLLTNANLVKISLQPDHSAANNFEFVTITKSRTVSIQAKYYILCTGGIETARILLSNQHQISCGIGNEKDLVGRYLQDHPGLRIGSLPVNHTYPDIQKTFNVHYFKGRKYSVRFSLSPQEQKKSELLNASAGVVFDFDEASVYSSINNIANQARRNELSLLKIKDVLNIVKKSPDLVIPLYYYLVKNRMYKPGTIPNIDVIMEQEPNPESRVELSTAKDELGIPLSKIKWKLTDLTWKTTLDFSAIIVEEFKRTGLGNITLFDEISANQTNWQNLTVDRNHHMGTTRMSETTETGVVNGDCKMHTVDNLYIASSSVFPTGGHSNPTLTIIALAYRIIDKIKERLTAE